MNQNHNKSDMDGVFTFFIAIGSLLFFSYFIWGRFHTEISTVFIYFRNSLSWIFYQMYYVLVQVTGSDFPVIRTFLSSITELCAPSDKVHILSTCQNEFSTITFKQISSASLLWNVIFSGIALCIAFLGYLRISENHPKLKYGKKHSLDSFIEEQVINQPHLKVYSEFNLQKCSQNEGPFMGMKTSREFAKENGLVDSIAEREIQYISNGITKSQKDRYQHVPTVNRNKLVKILRKQLGGLWVGVDHLTNEETVLLAMYLPRACSVSPLMSDKEFKQIYANCMQLEEEFWFAVSDDIHFDEQFKFLGVSQDNEVLYPDGDKVMPTHKINFVNLRKTINKYINHPESIKLQKQHAYTRTFLISVIFQARRLGVMAPCQLRWLKFYNREMWALLQNIGRPSFYCENMGAISHYQAEVIAGTRIDQPHFDVAIKGFEFQLQSYFYSPEALKSYGLSLDLPIENDSGFKLES